MEAFVLDLLAKVMPGSVLHKEKVDPMKPLVAFATALFEPESATEWSTRQRAAGLLMDQLPIEDCLRITNYSKSHLYTLHHVYAHAEDNHEDESDDDDDDETQNYVTFLFHFESYSLH